MLRAPFPWFGGKSRVASLVWDRFGAVANYVEPFAGSLAVLLGRPASPGIGIETVNDKDGFIANFWRALAADHLGVAAAADWPVNENDLHARHAWLVRQRETLTARLEGDPDFYDVKIAGWWVWGISAWIGGGWCSGNGPWQSNDAGQLVNLGNAGQGVRRQRVQLGNAGQGVHRKRVHLLDSGRGVHRKRVHLKDGPEMSGLESELFALSARLRYVRVCCGDWLRVCGPAVTVTHGLTGVFLDPPYSVEERDGNIYSVDSSWLSASVMAWAIEHGDHPLLRIALCGYDGEHAMPESWEKVEWKASGGYGNQGAGRGRVNAGRERIWFSPACIRTADKLW